MKSVKNAFLVLLSLKRRVCCLWFVVRYVPFSLINLPVQVREQPAALIFPPNSDSAGESVGGHRGKMSIALKTDLLKLCRN